MEKGTGSGFVDFVKYHVGTDKQVAAFLLVIAALMFLVCYMDFILTAEDPTDDTSRYYYNMFAFLLASCLLLLGSIFTLIVSYPNTFNYQMKEIIDKRNSENFFVLAAMLYFLAFVAFYVWPCWAANDGTLGVFWAIVYIAVVVCGSAIFGFMIFSSAGANLGENNGRGSNYVWQLCAFFDPILCCDCWSQDIKDFWESHLGSDYVISWWGFLIVAFLTVPLCLYFLVLNYTSMFAYIYFLASIVFALAVFGIVYTSYMANWRSKFVWGIIEYFLLMCFTFTPDSASEAQPLSMA